MARIIMSFNILMLLGPLQHCHSHYLPLPSQPITFIGKKCHNNVKVHDVHARSVIPRGGDTTASTDEATPEVITNTTDIEAISNRLKREEIQKVKEAQKFLKMQQMRREKDVTWLDKCITGTIEFFENVFRWEVIDVKK